MGFNQMRRATLQELVATSSSFSEHRIYHLVTQLMY